MKNNLKNISNSKKRDSPTKNKGLFAVLVVITVVIAVAIAFSFFNIPGLNNTATAPNENAGASLSKATTPKITTACTDTDGGMNPFLKGTCSGTNGNFTDICNTNTSVKEYYCSSNNTCESLIGNCTWFSNISTGKCKDGMCELKPQVANEINALMLSMISGVKIREKKGVDLATLNIQSARTNGDNPVVDGIFGGFGAKCDCVGCSGSGDCESHNDDFLGCMATNCQCHSRQDPSWCFWNVEAFGYWAW
jgi:hypothetical protein